MISTDTLISKADGAVDPQPRAAAAEPAPIRRHPSSGIPLFNTPSGRLFAMLACALLGAAVTWAALTYGAGDFRFSLHGLVARGALDNALSRQLTGDIVVTDAPRVGLTFADASGMVCRTFVTTDNEGLACRDGRAWRIDVAARVFRSDSFRRAGTNPVVLDAVEARVTGGMFDPDREKAARDRNWRN